MEKSDPKLFREMSEPFESASEADAAINAFFDELGELRKRHGFPNVYVIVGGSIVADSGDEHEFVSTLHYGNGLQAEPLTAYAFGKEQARREQAIADAVKHGKRK